MRDYSIKLTGFVILSAANLAFLPSVGHAADWWVQGGPVIRGGMSVDVKGSSYSQTLGQHAVANALEDPSGIGTSGAYADRTYDNGYVGKSPSTGNPAAIDPNTTWNWGYNNPSQYDAAGGQLSFSKQGVPGYTPTRNSSLSGDDTMLGAGVELSAGVRLKESGKWSFDLGLGLQGMWGANANLNGSTYAERMNRVDVTDRYNVSGIPAAAFPAAGHHGTYNGPFDPAATPPYTIIPNLPARGRQTVDLGWTAQNSVNLDVDMALYQIALNPSISFAASKRLSLCLTPKVSLNIMDVSASRSEIFYQTQGGVNTTLNQWSDNSSKTQLAFGLGATLGANYDLGKGWYTGVFGGYEWVMDKMNVQVGPNNVAFDASGWTVGVNFGRHF